MVGQQGRARKQFGRLRFPSAEARDSQIVQDRRGLLVPTQRLEALRGLRIAP